ncbi:MAG: hypothetical protein HQL75_05945 [Magnetococcales bacterium]|nr:hypothetical protein [Magnetococcales bacterium]
MTQAVTFDDVWKMFQETDRKFQETDRKFQETDRKFQETDRKFQETDREIKENARGIKETWLQMKETDRKFQETDRKFQETDRKLQEMFQETDREIKENAREAKKIWQQMKETDIKIKEVSTQIGNLGGKWGKFVEWLISPACEVLFAQRGIPVHQVSRQVKAKLPGGRQIEIDVFVVNTDAVVLVEVKSTLTVGYVREHLARLAEFKEFFPVYADKRVIGAVAGIVIDEDADRFAINKGLFVIEQTGDALRMANDATFVPRVW